MTENQLKAFGFIGSSQLWDEITKLIQEMQEQAWMSASSQETRGEDRIHACGHADGINLVFSTLFALRNEAKKINGLTE
jgi:hypothetical protein